MCCMTPPTGKFLVSIPQVGSDLTKGSGGGDGSRQWGGHESFQRYRQLHGGRYGAWSRRERAHRVRSRFSASRPSCVFAEDVCHQRSHGKDSGDDHAGGGEDEVWYNPGDGHYYTGYRDFFTNPSATSATPVLGVIDADTNQWVEDIPTGPNSHSVAANPHEQPYLCSVEESECDVWRPGWMRWDLWA